MKTVSRPNCRNRGGRLAKPALRRLTPRLPARPRLYSPPRTVTLKSTRVIAAPIQPKIPAEPPVRHDSALSRDRIDRVTGGGTEHEVRGPERFPRIRPAEGGVGVRPRPSQVGDAAPLEVVDALCHCVDASALGTRRTAGRDGFRARAEGRARRRGRARARAASTT